jgi:two-component system response regulator
MSNDVEILLVEDNPHDLELTLHALKQNNIANHIEVVRDGEEALDYLFRRRGYSTLQLNAKPRLVLLDLKLPKVDGLEVLKEMKADPDIRRIPVVILTASREEQDVIRSYELGVNSYIVKPVDFDKFIEAVKQLGLYWLLLNEPAG